MNLKKLYNKYKDVIPYLFFGVCTTVINVVVYWLMAHPLGMGTTISTLVAWLVAVIFAYVTNRKWVFHSKAKGRKEILEEIGSFFACRIGTGIVDWVIMLLFVDLIGFNDVIIKFLANVIVIILNYIASKFIIFSTENLLKKIIMYFKVKNKRKDFIIGTCLAIFFFVVSFIFLIDSPMHIWRNSVTSVDSSVFRTIALQMKEGLLPYKDTFDHKGPLLFFINYIGTNISFNNGIWLIELISLFIACIFMYKVARLKTDKISSVFIVMISLSLLLNYFEGGNLTEEYALPFLCSSLYIFLDYLLNKKVTNFRLIMCGLSLGGVLLLKPNMISLWVIFVLVIFIECLLKKNYKDLKKFIIYFLLGLCIIILPFILWLGFNGILVDCWHSYIVFNGIYSSNLTSIQDKLSSLLYFGNNLLLIFSFVICVILGYRNKEKIYYYHFAYLVLTLLFVCLSGAEFPHYGMNLVPCIIFPISSLFDLCRKDRKHSDLMIIFVSMFFVYNVIFPNWVKLGKLFVTSYFDHSLNESEQRYLDISNIIKLNTIENEKISVYGNRNIYYLLSDRLPGSKYSYQIPIGWVSGDIMDQYYNDLINNDIRLIVIDSNRIDDKMIDFLDKFEYSLIWKEESENGVLIYRK